MDWFDVGNYDQCELWTAEEWYRAIWCRNTLSGNVSNQEVNSIKFDSFFGSEKYTDSEITLLWKDILLKLHNDPLGQSVFPDFFGRKERIVYPAVYSLDLLSLGSLYQNLIGPLDPHEQAVLAGEKDDEILNALCQQSVEERQMCLGYEKEFFGNCAIAVVNLDAPDHILESQFKEFVESRRSILGVDALSDVPNKVKFSSWTKNRILGYFDLLLFMKTQHSPLTDEQIGTLLFPDEYDVSLDDRVRKTIRPNANKVFNQKMLRALCA